MLDRYIRQAEIDFPGASPKLQRIMARAAFERDQREEQRHAMAQREQAKRDPIQRRDLQAALRRRIDPKVGYLTRVIGKR